MAKLTKFYSMPSFLFTDNPWKVWSSYKQSKDKDQNIEQCQWNCETKKVDNDFFSQMLCKFLHTRFCKFLFIGVLASLLQFCKMFLL